MRWGSKGTDVSKLVSRNGWYHFHGGRPGHRVRLSLHTRNKREAERSQRFIDRQNLLDMLGVKPPDIDPEQFKERYLEYSKTNKAEKTFVEDRRVLRLFFAQVRVKDLALVSPSLIETWKNVRAQRISPVSVNHELRHLQAAFGMAETWSLIEHNPFRRVKKIRVDRRDPIILSPEQVMELLNRASDENRPFFMLALYTGMRLGEIVHLRPQDIDWQARVIHVANRASWHTKSRRERRIPIHPDLYRILKGLPRDGETLWPYTADTLAKRFKRTAKTVGLSNRITFHTLRHTFASYLVQLGQPIRQVQELLGHSNVTVTEMYAHLGVESLVGVVAALEYGRPADAAQK